MEAPATGDRAGRARAGCGGRGGGRRTGPWEQGRGGGGPAAPRRGFLAPRQGLSSAREGWLARPVRASELPAAVVVLTTGSSALVLLPGVPAGRHTTRPSRESGARPEAPPAGRPPRPASPGPPVVPGASRLLLRWSCCGAGEGAQEGAGVGSTEGGSPGPLRELLSRVPRLGCLCPGSGQVSGLGVPPICSSRSRLVALPGRWPRGSSPGRRRLRFVHLVCFAQPTRGRAS